MDKKTRRTSTSKRLTRRLTQRLARATPHQSAICFMSVEPHPSLIAFAERLAVHHRVYIVLDSNDCVTPPTNYVTFVRLQDDFCRQHGYIHSNPAFEKTPTAWDKALLYFCMIETSYKHIWFVEEDVFIPTTTMLSTLSAKYPNADLLVSAHNNRLVNVDWSWWPAVDGLLEPPMFHAMVCAVRMSRALLQAIAAYAKERGRLIFIEIMFNTLAHQRGLRIETPIEMKYILHRHDWNEAKLSKDLLIHPVKDLALHDTYRAALADSLEHNLS